MNLCDDWRNNLAKIHIRNAYFFTLINAFLYIILPLLKPNLFHSFNFAHSPHQFQQML